MSFITFQDISDFSFADIEAMRDNVTIFKGKIISKSAPTSSQPEPITYQAYSTTGILEDSTIPLSGYPIQVQNKSLKEIVSTICSYFDVTVKFDISANSDINKKYILQDQSPDKKAKSIIDELCSQRNLLLTHNSKGELIITKNIVGKLANPPRELKITPNYNYRGFFNTYQVVGQQSVSDESERQATSTFDQIQKERIITSIQKDGNADAAQNQADSMKFDSYKSNSLNIDYHDYLASVGDVFIVNNNRFICNSLNYEYEAGKEGCTVSLLNEKVYTR